MGGHKTTMSNYQKQLEIEAETWCIKDDIKRAEKLQREVIRYPYMFKLMNLENLDTSNMFVLDIGGGVVGLSSLVECKNRVVLDPLTDEYKKYFACPNHIKGYGESIPFPDSYVDLVIITNALDHCQDPISVLKEVKRVLKAGGYFCHGHAINNAITNKHPAHKQNINPFLIKRELQDECELVWSYDYKHNGARYGHILYNGVIGQPAFYQMWRKVTGYPK
jgi:SAM-dependent methyltransferase